MTRPAIVRTEQDERADFEVPDPSVTAAEQMAGLEGDLKRDARDFLALPFPSLANLVGGIPTGELWYLGAFSGDGKTTFLTSLTLALLSAGRKVYYVPTESPGRVIRAHLACKTLEYEVGDFLSGAYLAWPDAKMARARVLAEAKQYATAFATLNAGEDRRLWIAESGFLTPHRIHAEADIASELGADVMIWDHGDHTEDTGRSLYETSVVTQKAILTATQTYDLRSIVSTQFNLDAVKGNRTLRYMAPREGYVYMGNIKRQICDGMIGLYRPLKLQGLDTKLLSAYRDGDESVKRADILEPETMCAYVMKHRKYGAREGMKVYLQVHRGKVQDFADRDLGGALHGIRTGGSVR